MEDFRSKMKSDQFDKIYEDWDNEESWKEIEQRLPKKRKRRFWILLIGIGIGLVLTLTIFTSNRTQPVITKQLDKIEQPNVSINKSNDLIKSEQALASKERGNELISNSEHFKNKRAQTRNNTNNSSDSKTFVQQQEPTLTKKDHIMTTGLEMTVSKRSRTKSIIKSELESAFIEPKSESGSISSITLASENLTDESLARNQAEKLLTLPHSQHTLTTLIKKDHALPVVSKLKRKSLRPWFFSIEGGFGAFSKSIRPTNQESLDLINLRQNTESPEEFIYFEFRGTKQITEWGLSAYVGFSYNQFNERLFHQYTTETVRQITSDEASYVELLDGSRFYLPGLLNERTIIRGEINKYNETRILKVPFGLIYEKRFGRLKLGAHLGTYLSLHSKATGDIVFPDNKVVDKLDLGDFKTDLMSLKRYKTGIRVNIQLSEYIELTSSINYTLDLLSIDGPFGMQEEFRSYSLGVGATTVIK